jgi:hypothetical protein
MPTIRLPDGTPVEYPEGMDPERAGKIIAARFAGQHGLKKEAATKGSDIVAGLLRGGAGIAELGPNLYTLATGKEADNVLTRKAKELRKSAAGYETPLSVVQGMSMDQAIAAAEKNGTWATIVETAKQLGTNPRVLLGKVAETVPDILTSGGVGALAKAGVKTGIKALGRGATGEAVEKAATKAGIATAVGTSSTQEGASTGKQTFDEVYKEVRRRYPELSEEESRAYAVKQARVAGLLSGAMSAATGAALPGVEKTLLRGVGTKGAIRGGAKTGLGESLQETTESGTSQLLQNLGVQPVAPEVSTGRGVARAATEGAIIGGIAGGVPGAISGLRGGEAAPEVPPNAPAAPPAATPAGEETTATGEPAKKTFTRAKLSEQLNTVKVAAPQLSAEVDKLLAEVEATKGAKSREGRDARAAIAEKVEELRVKAEEEVKAKADAEANKANVVTAAVNAGATPNEVATALNIAGQGATNETGVVAGGNQPSLGVAPSATGLPGAGEVQVPAPSGMAGVGTDVGPAPTGEGIVQPALNQAAPPAPPPVPPLPPAAPVAETAAPITEVPTAETPVAEVPVTEAAAAEPAVEPPAAEAPKLEAKPYRVDKVDTEGKPAWQAVDPQTGTVAATYPTRTAAIDAIKTGGGKVTTAKTKAAPAAVEPTTAAVEPTAPAVAAPAVVEEQKPKAGAKGRKVESRKQIVANLRDRINTLKKSGVNERDASKLANAVDQLDEIEDLPPKEQKTAASVLNRIHSDLTKIEESRAGKGIVVASKDETDRVEAGIKGKDIIGVAQWIAQNGPNPVYRFIARAVAKRLEYLQKLGAEFTFDVATKGNIGPRSLGEKGTAGVTVVPEGRKDAFTAGRVSIAVWVNGSDLPNRPPGTSFEVVLHELVHAATSTALDFAHLDKNLEKFKKNLEAIFKKVEAQFKEDSKYAHKTPPFVLRAKQGITNVNKDIHEMLAWALTNSDMQTYMDKISYGKKSAWGDFVNTIRGFLGLPINQNTALSGLLETAGKLLAADLEGLYIRSTGSVGTATFERAAQLPPLDLTIGGEKVNLLEGVQPPTKKATREAKTKKQKAKALRKANLQVFGNQPEGRYNRLVRIFQNGLRPIFTLRDRMKAAGVEITEDLDLPTAMTNAIGEAEAIATLRVDKTDFEYKALLKDFAKAMGMKINKANDFLSNYFVAMHEPERRETKFYEQVKLSEEGQRERERLMGVLGDQNISQQKKIAAYADLKTLVENDPVAEGFDIDSSAFGVVGIRADDGVVVRLTSSSAQAIQKSSERLIASKNAGDLVAKIIEKRKELDRIAQDLRREANFDSKGYDDFIAARGWQHYVPFQGLPTREDSQEFIDSLEEAASAELAGTAEGFKGRKSEAENVILRGMANAQRAAGLKGVNRTTSIIRKLVEEGFIDGKVKKQYTFQEGLIDPSKRKIRKTPNTVIHHEPNGDVYTVEINDPLMARAIQRTYKESALAKLLAPPTRFIGNMLTFYNPVFWVTNYFTDVLTNTWKITAERGLSAGTKYLIRATAVDLAMNGGLPRAIRFMQLYNSRSPASKDKLKALAAKNAWYRDAMEYIQVGGKVAYRSGLGTEAQRKELMPSGLGGAKDAFDNFISFLPDGFELASRVSAYRVMKDMPEYKGRIDAAVAETKNLSNFEQTGEMGRILGSLFLFFRPSATGAVAALDALSKGKHRATAVTLATLMGVGAYVLAKALSDTDDEDRNKAELDDPSRWVRGPRFFVPGTDYVIQGRWGFGIGGVASTAAQLMMFAEGRMDLSTLAHNLRILAQESVLPLPASQMNEFENPTKWLIDSILPSVARPIAQYAMNNDALDRAIYQKGSSRYSSAYVAGEGIPESAKEFSRAVYDAFDGEVPGPLKGLTDPKAIQFFMNNYASGFMKLFSLTDEVLRDSGAVGEQGMEQKEVDWVKKLPFVTVPANYDVDQFYKTEKRINEIDQAINTFKKRNPDKYEEYIDKYPEREEAVKFFNKQKNGELKKLRAEANKISYDKDLSPKERADEIKENRLEQAEVMRGITTYINELLAQ